MRDHLEISGSDAPHRMAVEIEVGILGGGERVVCEAERNVTLLYMNE